jgi:hypothetical protein
MDSDGHFRTRTVDDESIPRRTVMVRLAPPQVGDKSNTVSRSTRRRSIWVLA